MYNSTKIIDIKNKPEARRFTVKLKLKFINRVK